MSYLIVYNSMCLLIHPIFLLSLQGNFVASMTAILRQMEDYHYAHLIKTFGKMRSDVVVSSTWNILLPSRQSCLVFLLQLYDEETNKAKKPHFITKATWPDIKINEALLFAFWAKSKVCFVAIILNYKTTDRQGKPQFENVVYDISLEGTRLYIWIL